MKENIIIWFRNDLRLKDHPALFAARNQIIFPVYIFSDEEEDDWQIGGASKWWLHHSLTSLQKDLKEHGLELIIRSGNALDELEKLCNETESKSVYWCRRYEPYAIKRDIHVKSSLK